MTYLPHRLKLAKLQVDMNYNAAFNYWGLKGVIAERWAHGPIFSAFADLGNQVNLSQVPGAGPPVVNAFYGIQASTFNSEPVGERAAASTNAVSFMSDVAEVLKPKRVTRVGVTWFGIYPIGDAAHATEASARLRGYFYRDDRLQAITPARQSGDVHSAVEIFIDDTPRQTTVVVGVIGPPHKGVYLITSNPRRDSTWWMGFRVTSFAFDEENGIPAPIEELNALLEQSHADYERVTSNALPLLF